ncbi:MAG: FGGY family carbohydrate kinase [Balneolaceae bacterium]
MSKSQTPVTAVFDIGKTNKKFILFDGNYDIVYRVEETFKQVSDEDGFPCEDLDALVNWIHTELSSVIENEEFDITDLNFSTYGASLVHLDENNKVVTPLYDYLKPIPEDLKHRFYETYGGEKEFSVETASPPMGMLNSGLQLYWLKNNKPDVFKKIRYSLHFPQYLSHLFTGKHTSEPTSVGCHTAMWNFTEQKYHRWLKEEGVINKLPDVIDISDTLKREYKNTKLNVGLGIHDSSASIVPYINSLSDPFLLVSTGTWSITLNPFNKDPLTYEELKRDCLCYLNIYGKQVKASRVFLGNEYRHQKEKLVEYFKVAASQNNVIPDRRLLNKLIADTDYRKKLKLETAQTSGPYPSEEAEEWDISVFKDYKEAYHQLMIDLVSIQETCIKLAEGSDKINNVIVTGGFSNNDFFIELLASRMPEKNIYTNTIPHATALGAAMVMHDNPKNEVNDNLNKLLELKLHDIIDGIEFENYSWSKG